MNSIIRVTAIDCQIASVNETATEIATLLNAERQNPKKQAEKCADLFEQLNANAMELVSQGLVQATERKDGTREVKQKELNDFVTKLFHGYLTGKSAKKYADTCNAIRGKYPEVWDNLTLGKLTILSTFETKAYLDKMPKGLGEFLVWLGDYTQNPMRESYNQWDEEYTEKMRFRDYLHGIGDVANENRVNEELEEMDRNAPDRPIPPNDPNFSDTMTELAIYALDEMSDSQVRRAVTFYLEEIGMKTPKQEGTSEDAEGTAEGTAEGKEEPKPKTQAELKADALTALQAYMETLDKVPLCYKKAIDELSK